MCLSPCQPISAGHELVQSGFEPESPEQNSYKLTNVLSQSTRTFVSVIYHESLRASDGLHMVYDTHVKH